MLGEWQEERYSVNNCLCLALLYSPYPYPRVPHPPPYTRSTTSFSCSLSSLPYLSFFVLLCPILPCSTPSSHVSLCCVAVQGQAANTANRRVLVTDKNGNQAVQTIRDELGMKAKDMGDIKRRLGSQGVDTSHVEMYGQAENKMEKPSNTV